MTSKIHRFLSVWSLYQSYPLIIICFLSFSPKKSPISTTKLNVAQKAVLKEIKAMIDVKLTFLRIFGPHLQSSFHSWIHSANSFCSSFKGMILSNKIQQCGQLAVWSKCYVTASLRICGIWILRRIIIFSFVSWQL